MKHHNPLGSYEPQQPINPAQPSTPPAPPAPPTAPTPTTPPASAGIIILQWLTYAFWGWTVLALSALTAAVLSNMIADADTGGFTPYAIAAVLVLLPIALVCDHLYSKHEPEKKMGGAMIVMVIHAVIFGLLGVGSLIWSAFNIVALMTSSTDHPGLQVSLYSSLIVTVYFAVTFVRTLSPVRFKWIRRAFQIFMLTSITIIAILGIVGPVASANKTKDDKLIQNNIYSVTTAISSYSRTNKKLPESLNDLSLNGDSKKLVEKNLLRYTPNTYQAPTPLNSTKNTTTTKPTTTSTTYSSLSTTSTYYYTLCATFKQKSSGYSDNDNYSYGQDEYSTTVSVYRHPAGEVCYT